MIEALALELASCRFDGFMPVALAEELAAMEIWLSMLVTGSPEHVIMR